MTKIYKLSLKPISGYLTELESDTIFGHFCWRMKEISGEEKLINLLELYKSNKPVFTFSNGIIDYESKLLFPVPLIPSDFKPHHDLSKMEKIKAFEEHKKNKEEKYVLIDEFNDIINGNVINNQGTKTINLNEIIIKDIRTGVEIDRNTLHSKQGQLFTLSPTYIKNANVCILIKVIDEDKFKEFHCEEIIKSVFETGYGLKKSSGYGQFEVNGFSEFNDFKEPEDANGFITLSNYLPTEDDGITDKHYDFFVKYGKLGEGYSLTGNPFKYPIIFIKEGSCFKTDKQADYYGRCTGEGEISKRSEVMQLCVAFTLKMKMN